jgi:hypothetical protein
VQVQVLSLAVQARPVELRRAQSKTAAPADEDIGKEAAMRRAWMVLLFVAAALALIVLLRFFPF